MQEKIKQGTETVPCFILYLVFICFSDLNSSDLAADGLGQLVNEFNDSGVLVRSGVALYVALNFLYEIVGGDGALGEHDGRLYRLTSYGVGNTRDSALKNVGKLHDNAFDLKGTDAVSR